MAWAKWSFDQVRQFSNQKKLDSRDEDVLFFVNSILECMAKLSNISNTLEKSYEKFCLTSLLENGTVFISEGAVALALKNGLWKPSKNLDYPTGQPSQYYLRDKIQPGFVWEHIVPVNHQISILQNKKRLTQLDLLAHRATYGYVCIVTADEDKKLLPRQSMPQGIELSEKTVFSRYDNNVNIVGCIDQFSPFSSKSSNIHLCANECPRYCSCSLTCFNSCNLNCLPNCRFCGKSCTHPTFLRSCILHK